MVRRKLKKKWSEWIEVDSLRFEVICKNWDRQKKEENSEWKTELWGDPQVLESKGTQRRTTSTTETVKKKVKKKKSKKTKRKKKKKKEKWKVRKRKNDIWKTRVNVCVVGTYYLYEYL